MECQKLGRDLIGFVLLFVCVLLLSGTIDYSGDFALNDDWGYSTPIRWWLEDGSLQLTHWQSMPLVTHFANGAAWSSIFGFSQEALRTLTLGFAALAIMSCYGLSRVCGLGHEQAFLIAAVVLVSPIFMTLSFSFMSDIPFTALALASCFALSLSLQSTGRTAGMAFTAGAILLLLSVALRQVGLGVALAFMIAQFFRKEGTTSARVSSIVVVILGFAIVAAIPELYDRSGILPRIYYFQTDTMIDYFDILSSFSPSVIKPPIFAALHFLGYFGLLLIPAAPFILTVTKLSIRAWAFVLIGAVVLTWLSNAVGQLVIANSNTGVLNYDGAGPRLVAGEMAEFHLFAIALTCLCMTLSIGVLTAVAVNFRTFDRSAASSVVIFIILSGVIAYGPHGLTFFALFDRYTLLPSIMVLIGTVGFLAKNSGRLTTPRSSLVLTIAFGAVSAVLVSDMFAWQRARYALIREAQSTHTLADYEIDGGFEYNNLTALLDNPTRAHLQNLAASNSQDYRIAKSIVEGHVVLAKFDVPQLLGLATAPIYLLRVEK